MDRRHFIQMAGAGALTVAAHGLLQCGNNSPIQEGGIQLGCLNRPWSGLPLEEVLDAIKNAGYEYCGFLGHGKSLPIGTDNPADDATAMKKVLDERKLKLRMIMIRPDLSKPVKEVIDELIPQAEAVKTLGVRHILSLGTGREEEYPRYIELMKYYAEELLRRDMLVVMKPHGGISATGDQCVEVVEKINSEGFRICYDPGNIIYYTNTDPAEDVKSVAHYVKAMCIKDCRGSAVTGNGDVNVTPGDGEVDFATVFDVLKKAGLSGPCLIETLGGKTPDENNEEAKRALQFLKKFI